MLLWLAAFFLEPALTNRRRFHPRSLSPQAVKYKCFVSGQLKQVRRVAACLSLLLSTIRLSWLIEMDKLLHSPWTAVYVNGAASLMSDDGTERWSQSNTPPALTLNGYSRPLLLDGGVLVGLDDGRLLALNTNSGELIWESVLSVPRGRSEVERLVDIDADIAIDDEGIYVANYQGKAARLEPGRGQIVWSTPLSAGSGIALNDVGLIVINEDDSIIKLDKETGQQL